MKNEPLRVLPVDSQSSQNNKAIERLLESSAALHKGKNQKTVMTRVLEGVKTIGFDRVRLYLLSPDQQTLTGIAQLGIGQIV